MVMGRLRSDIGPMAKGVPLTRMCSCGRVWPRSEGETGPNTVGVAVREGD